MSELKNSTDLTDAEIVLNFGSTNCLGCGGKKSKRKSFCRVDYYKCPPELRNRQYDRIGQGYEQAIRDSIDFLRNN